MLIHVLITVQAQKRTDPDILHYPHAVLRARAVYHVALTRAQNNVDVAPRALEPSSHSLLRGRRPLPEVRINLHGIPHIEGQSKGFEPLAVKCLPAVYVRAYTRNANLWGLARPGRSPMGTPPVTVQFAIDFLLARIIFGRAFVDLLVDEPISLHTRLDSPPRGA